MYWDAVLKEVLNKDNPSPTYTLTNVRENKSTTATGLVRESKVTPPMVRLKAKKYFLGEKYPGAYFTEREAQTINHLLQGKTAVEVARILRLSRRTIEFYLKNMKAKLKCRLKSELISKTIASDFSQNYSILNSQG